MKIVLFSLLCLILIGMISYSYAEWMKPGEATELPEVMIQLVVRDSNGYFLAYMESEQIIGLDPLELNRFLDNQNETRKEFLIKDDKKYESQQWEVTNNVFDQRLAYSITRLLDVYENEFVPLLTMRHESYQTQPGDTLRMFWTVIRPAS